MAHERLDRKTALALLTEAPQLDLMERADALRQAMMPGRDVTFVIDTNPNYTNVCVTDCTFCSFYRRPGDSEAYVHSPEVIGQKVNDAQAKGATTVLLQGGHNPELPFEYYLDLISAIKTMAPGVHLHLFSPSEIAQISEVANLAIPEVLQRFWEAGVSTMPGGGAEILSDKVRRKISPKKLKTDGWLDVMRQAHAVGMKTSATMTYGHVESPDDIIEHLLRLRELQDETGGFYAFIPWSFKPGGSPLSKVVTHPALSSRYVRIIAIARLVLDNFPHIQGSWFGEGWRAGQLSLHAGADDFGGILIEENVLNAAQHSHGSKLASVLRTIRDAGYTPVQRSTLYDHLKRYDIPLEEETTDADFVVRGHTATV